MKKHKDMVRVMIGSGESSTFVNVPRGKRAMIGSGENSMFIKAGVTPRSIDERFEELEKEWKKEERKDNIKKKVRTLFKKAVKNDLK